MIKVNLSKLNLPFLLILFSVFGFSKNKVSFIEPIANSENVRTGLDVLIEDHLDYLNSKNIGLITNHSGLTRNGEKNYKIFQQTKGINLQVIFAPEHGFHGEARAGTKVEYKNQNKIDPKIISLYGRDRRPTIDMLEGLDLIIYDIQDIGTRFYTYISTLGMTMEVAAKKNISIMILDRPNPLGGEVMEGAILDTIYKSFIGYYPIPTRYGLTVGELSYMACKNEWLSTTPQELIIVKMDNWRRSMYYDDTKLPWVKPSPNIPDLETAIIYPGMCLYEATNISEGRGTEKPFKIIGSPWMNNTLSTTMSEMNLTGAMFSYKNFIPQSIKGKSENPKYKNITCKGFEIHITDRDSFRSIHSAVLSLNQAYSLYNNQFELNHLRIKKLWGNDQIILFLNKELSQKKLFNNLKKGLRKFKKKAKPYLLYN